MSILSYLTQQRHYKLNFVAYPWFVQGFGTDVTFRRAWICAISATLNSTIVLLRDWPFYGIDTWWKLLFEIGADIFFFGFFAVCSVIIIGLFAWFLAILIKSLFESTTIYYTVRMLEDWQHIETVLHERIINMFFILSEAFFIYETIKYWEVWGSRL